MEERSIKSNLQRQGHLHLRIPLSLQIVRNVYAVTIEPQRATIKFDPRAQSHPETFAKSAEGN